jgi:exopolysaccharide biosynthesis polyprenyl glycosylphosphotransferase
VGNSDLSQDMASAITPQVDEAAATAGRTRPARVRRRTLAIRGPLQILCDTVALALSGLLVARGWPAVAYPVAVLAALTVLGRHRGRICMRVSDEVPRLAAAASLPLLLLVPWVHSLARLLIVGLVTASLVLIMRAALYASLRAAYRAGRLTEPVLIVGTGELGREIGELLLDHPDLGLRPVGFVGETALTSKTLASEPVPVLGGLSRTCDLVREHGVSKIIFSLPAEADDDLFLALRAECRCPADVYVVPPMHELASAIPAGCMDEIWGIPLLPLRRSGLETSGALVKRAFDLIVGCALLVAAAPLLLILVAVEFLDRTRPVMFRQERVTRSGRIMRIMKLRTMSSPDPDSEWSVPVESCSAIGRWLRATHLDELPQLFNVIRGDMSLVGPRPERPFFTARFAEMVPHYDDRHRTRAGLTGWAQVHGLTGDTSIPDRTRFDNYYIEHWSLWMDLVIMARTLAEPLLGVLRARQTPIRRTDSRS